MPMRSTFRRAIVAAAVLAATIALGSSLASGSVGVPGSHGSLLRLVKPGLGANASQSNNWFGYNQGRQERGMKFHSISGDWTVPSARQHTKGQSESSSTWIGIGGGCTNAKCTKGDNTLIQTGTEQDVSASGKPSYSAWWEIIPAPSSTIANMKVRPGDHMRASITEAPKGSEIWHISLQNLTRHESFKKTVPYTSTYATAEWIEETPIVIGTNAGLADLPRLSRTTFDRAKVNGAAAQLKAAERILLTTTNGKVIGTPSAPDPQRNGFALCAWATSCRAPGS
jgi:peptidase A4-like protein